MLHCNARYSNTERYTFSRRGQSVTICTLPSNSMQYNNSITGQIDYKMKNAINKIVAFVWPVKCQPSPTSELVFFRSPTKGALDDEGAMARTFSSAFFLVRENILSIVLCTLSSFDFWHDLFLHVKAVKFNPERSLLIQLFTYLAHRISLENILDFRFN